jgi:hypothetical protein
MGLFKSLKIDKNEKERRYEAGTRERSRAIKLFCFEAKLLLIFSLCFFFGVAPLLLTLKEH